MKAIGASGSGLFPPPVYIGELEQLLLLLILRLEADAHAVAIRDELSRTANRRLARGALYTALERLEEKGCLRSALGQPLPERGGRARRYFSVTSTGLRALRHSRRVLLRLWDGLEAKLAAP